MMKINLLLMILLVSTSSLAQTPPSASEYNAYNQGFKAIYDGDRALVTQLLAEGFALDSRDGRNRTPVHVAAHQSHDEMLTLLVEAGADINALEFQRYDVITIAAVADDVDLLILALELGGDPAQVTSLYDGTALIAAAHLGHAEVVRILLEAGAPVDHVNNLGWTALLEAVILGDGSDAYVKTIEHLLAHGADRKLADRQDYTPLDHARDRGYSRIVEMLSQRK